MTDATALADPPGDGAAKHGNIDESLYSRQLCVPAPFSDAGRR